MKKRIISLVSFFLLIFNVAPAFAQTGTYTASNPLDVHINAGIGSTDSASYAAIYTKSDGSSVDPSPDGDYWITATIGGYLAAGATWGFKYFDPSSSTWKHVGNFTSSPTGSVDLTQFGIAPPEPASVGIWVDNSGASSGDSWIYMSQIVSHDGAVINFPTPSGYTGSPTPPITIGVSEPPIPPPPPPPDWNAVAKTFSDVFQANTPPIPPPPDPASQIPAPQPTKPAMPTQPTMPDPNQVPAKPTQKVTAPPVTVPQPPQEGGVQPFDLTQNQPHITVDTSQSKPFKIDNTPSQLPHDPVGQIPVRGQNEVPSGFNNPVVPSTNAPVYSGSQSTPSTNIPMPSATPPSTTNAISPAPPPPGSGSVPIRTGSSNNPNPTYGN